MLESRAIELIVQNKFAGYGISFGTITVSVSTLVELVNPLLSTLGLLLGICLTCVLILRHIEEIKWLRAKREKLSDD